MSNGQDPRETVTPDAFSVAPELLGLPLAPPWRRAAAMLIDLLLIALLANARGVLLAVAAGAFLFWLAYRGRREQVGSKMARAGVGCGGALLVFVAVLAIWSSIFVSEDTVLFESEGSAGETVPVTIGAALDFASILGAADSVEAEAAAVRLVERLERQGVSRERMRAWVSGLSEDASPSIVRAVERAVGSVGDTTEYAALSLDTLWTMYETARADRDSARLRVIGSVFGRRIASAAWEERERRLAQVEMRNETLLHELEETEEALADERDRGVVATIRSLLDELGLGIGWSGLYFTFLTAFFRGRTPGKRLLGIRVLRLDGKPLTYWLAFERFGGYAASLFTGMEGFLRILWDRNRQGLEDKLAETVVIRDTKAATAQLAAATVRRGLADDSWGPAS